MPAKLHINITSNSEPERDASTPPSDALVAHAPTAIVPAKEGLGWDKGIDEEVERLLRAEVGNPNLGVPPVAPLAKMPKLTSALLSKLPGGATGPQGKQLIRAKEIERRLNAARAKYRNDKKEAMGEKQKDDDFTAAAAALTELESNSFKLIALQKGPFQSLVRALGAGRATGNKPDLVALLEKKFGHITMEQFERLRAAVQRGVAQAALPAPPKPMALPEPAPKASSDAAPAAVEDTQPRALRKPRRGEPLP